MISQCPHCKKNLELSDAQLAKVKQALAKLPEDGNLKLGCPLCRQPILLSADGNLADGPGEKKEEGEEETAVYVPQPIKDPPDPPAPPDISWMATGDFKAQAIVEDKPMALVLMPASEGRDAVERVYREMGYKTVLPESAEDALERMQFVTFSAVIFHAGYEGGTLSDSLFHSYMCEMSMKKRRYIYYVLTGPDFHTLYDLEALAHSANVVINENDLSLIDTILKKGMQDYEKLFGPLIEAMRMKGKN